MTSLLVCLALGAMAAPLEREVRFADRDGFELVGALTLPPNAVRSPAVLLLPGSGPTDRDGNQPPMLVTDLLKTIAFRSCRQWGRIPAVR